MNLWSLISIIMLFGSMCFYISFCKRSKSSIISTFTLFVGIWLIIIVLYIINIYNFNDVSKRFYLLLLFGISFWLLGFFTTRYSKNRMSIPIRIYISRKNVSGQAKRFSEYCINLKVLYFYLCVTAGYSIILWALCLRYMANGGSYALFHAMTFGDVEGVLFSSTFMNRLYNHVMYPMCLALAPVIPIGFFTNKRKTIYILSAIVIVVYCTAVGRRFPILYLCLYFVLSLPLFRINIPPKTIRKIFVFCFLFFALLIYITAWRKHVFETGEWSLVFESFYTYFNMCLPIGDHWIKYIDHFASDVWMFGYSFFRGILYDLTKLLGEFGSSIFSDFDVLINIAEDNFIEVGPHYNYNAFATWIYFFYLDFRELGIVFGSYIFGFVVGYVERQAFKINDLFHIAFYLLLSQAVLKSFVRWEFNEISYIWAFIYLRVLLKRQPIESVMNSVT